MPDRQRPDDWAIDIEQVTALFADLDRDTRTLLLDAAQRDLAEWTDRLVVAWDSGDEEGQRRARHSLKGLCGNFGASGLLALCEADLSEPGVANRLQSARAATAAALANLVAELPQ
ncbi:hypothetical protein CHU93_11300 [Sandarakinorhabdus cyanobacteriorum]|uniref:Uncharacterized protein n=1 Tax=Sandarakinorhabdus cyanobacteriorum TaxID=1981098 RepID=A0A255YD06_9SPHN|nr:Hpt domain-containing protein [Sandarakinorhabdus cyanobacteriorum]OYQ27089.1 hypothetical protein CHU93_11300 [Sandarakinorhabdus cyanobacteriorum]